MIIAEKSRRRALRLILIILCISIFVGCSQIEGDAFLALGEMMETERTQQIRCEVIYREDASATLVDAARDLAQAVEEQTEMDTLVHSGEVNYLSGCFYIVIGKVNDGVTQYWYHGMKSDDYVCRAYENIVALGGVSESATLEAIERFEGEVLPTAESGYFADDGVVFRHAGEYDIDKVLLNGYELGDYTFSVNDTQAIEAVRCFRDKIAQSSGDYPDIVTDKPTSDNMYITVDIDSSHELFKISFRTENGNIHIATDSVYGLAVGLDELYAKIMNSVADNVASFNVKEEFICEYSDARLRVSSFLVDNAAIDDGGIVIDTEKIKKVSDAIIASGADIVILDDGISWEYLAANIIDAKVYEIAQIKEGDELVSVVLYKSKFVRIENASTENKDGLLTLELEVYHIISEKNYNLLGFFSRGVTNANTLEDRIESKMEQTDGNTVAVYAVDKNISDALNINADGYNSNINTLAETQNLTYRIGAFTSDTLECYEKDVAKDTSEYFWAASVSVRLKYLPKAS